MQQIFGVALDPVSRGLLEAAKQRERNLKMLASVNVHQTGAHPQSRQASAPQVARKDTGVGTSATALYARLRETRANGGWEFSPLAVAAYASINTETQLFVCRHLDSFRGRESATGARPVDSASLRAQRR